MTFEGWVALVGLLLLVLEDEYFDKLGLEGCDWPPAAPALGMRTAPCPTAYRRPN
jgi:hypothetical protein